MNEMFEAFLKLEKSLSEKKGVFRLFALFMRLDTPGSWDLVISSTWADRDKTAALNAIASEMKVHLRPEWITSVSRIVTVAGSSDVVQTVARFCNANHTIFQLMDLTLGRIPIKHAVIFTAEVGSPGTNSVPMHTNTMQGAQPEWNPAKK
ncbi:MAG: hypothetical protein Q8N18_03575 [Opitutaceae bacterium]|nr:hypothetical protein [Opitutaceae bacterium]